MNTTSTTARPRGGKPALKKATTLKVSDETIGRLAKIFKLLADESRLKILLALAQDGEMHVSALCQLLGAPGKPASQAAVSHHLTLMRLTGLVSFRRERKNNFYRLESNQIQDLLEQVFAALGDTHKMIQFPDFALAYKPRAALPFGARDRRDAGRGRNDPGAKKLGG
jgi:ArsR family transcriptional regulator